MPMTPSHDSIAGPTRPPPNSAGLAEDRLELALAGSLLGTAVGDAIALPFEGMSRRRVLRFLSSGPLTHRLLFGRGLCSDDTEHSCLVAQALLAAGSEEEAEHFVAAFRRDFAWRLRWWLLALPAGIGMATLRAGVKLWLCPFGTGDGVFSAGNAPAMRSALPGICLGGRPDLLRGVVGAATRLTHTDPRAEEGALAVALAARLAAEGHGHRAADLFPPLFDQGVGARSELARLIHRAAESACRGEATEDFAAAIGCPDGVSGFMLHTVPVALHAWFRHPTHFAEAIAAVIRCGGDTDTTAAIVGGIVGAEVGVDGMPQDWLDGLAEAPRDRDWMRELCRRLAGRFGQGVRQAPPTVNAVVLVMRNLGFFALVLIHGFRRLLPPY